MINKNRKNNKKITYFFGKSFESFGKALLILIGLVVVYILLIAIFIKGTLSGWF